MLKQWLCKKMQSQQYCKDITDALDWDTDTLEKNYLYKIEHPVGSNSIQFFFHSWYVLQCKQT